MESRSHVRLVSRQSHARRRPRLNDERRSDLLRRIQDVILDEGFANLTVDELAARLQCSKSTLYAVSSSKEFLVTTAIKHFLDDVATLVEARVAEATEPVDRITTYLTAVGDEMQRMSQACFEDMGTNDSTREIYLAHSAVLRRRIAEFIDEGVVAGYFRPVHREFVADAVSLLIDGIQWGRLLEDTDLSPADAYAALSDLALAALTNRMATTRDAKSSGRPTRASSA